MPSETLMLSPIFTIPKDVVEDTGAEIIPLSIFIPVPIFTAPNWPLVACWTVIPPDVLIMAALSPDNNLTTPAVLVEASGIEIVPCPSLDILEPAFITPKVSLVPYSTEITPVVFVILVPV
mgnify:CR=1 FL=1